MPLKKFSMSFDSFRVMNLSFSVNESFKKKKTDKNLTPFDAQIRVAYSYDKKKRLTMLVRAYSVEGNIPFFFDVEGEGCFTFKDIPDENTIKLVSSVNAPAIMFPYIRETIADITRRAGFQPLHLPPINFVDRSSEVKDVESLSGKKKK